MAFSYCLVVMMLVDSCMSPSMPGPKVMHMSVFPLQVLVLPPQGKPCLDTWAPSCSGTRRPGLSLQTRRRRGHPWQYIYIQGLLEEQETRPLVVARNQLVRVVHAGAVHGEPVQHTEVRVVRRIETQQQLSLFRVTIWVLVPLALVIQHVGAGIQLMFESVPRSDLIVPSCKFLCALTTATTMPVTRTSNVSFTSSERPLNRHILCEAAGCAVSVRILLTQRLS